MWDCRTFITPFSGCSSAGSSLMSWWYAFSPSSCRRDQVFIPVTPSLGVSWHGSGLAGRSNPACAALKAVRHKMKRQKLKAGIVKYVYTIYVFVSIYILKKKPFLSDREGPNDGRQKEARVFKLRASFCSSQPPLFGQQASVFSLPYGLLAHTISCLTTVLMSKFWVLVVLLIE